jgi:arylsulfatase A
MKYQLLILLLTLSGFSLQASSRQPNIILIYADDLGAGLLGCYGQTIIQTPNIDRLADEGMQFSNMYGSVYCAPARATLLTGLHQGRAGVWNISKAGQTIAMDKGQLTAEQLEQKLKSHIAAKHGEVFLAQVAQEAGYKTAQFGKLDWGFQTTHERLKRHGWDHYLGYLDHQRAHGFYPTYLWLNGQKLLLEGNTNLNAGKTIESYGEGTTATRRDKTGKKHYSQNVFIKHILEYIEDNQEHPFFIYHSTQLPHGPVDIPEVHEDFINDDRLSEVEKEYASMVKMLDDHVGLILKKLEELGLDNDTILFFTSDNGHEIYYLEPKIKANGRRIEYHGETDVFRGSGDRAGLKWTSWQGGINVPMIARWPGKIKANSSSELLCANYDLMTTFSELMKTEAPQGKDGISFLPTLLASGKQIEHESVFVGNNALITQDGWKLVHHKKEDYLFNLKNDPGERTNLAQGNPEKLQALQKLFNREQNSKRKDL